MTDWSFERDGDEAAAHQPLDVLGVNHYNPTLLRQWDGAGPRETADGHQDGAASPWIACEDVEFVKQPGPYTEMGGNIDETGLTELLLRPHRDYPDMPTMITENGAAFPDPVAADGRVHAADHIDYLHSHLAAVSEAIAGGADVHGYFVWSLMDNFEWAHGYAKRFGIVHVDRETMERTWKDSAHWKSRRGRHRQAARLGFRAPRLTRRCGARSPCDRRMRSKIFQCGLMRFVLSPRTARAGRCVATATWAGSVFSSAAVILGPRPRRSVRPGPGCRRSGRPDRVR